MSLKAISKTMTRNEESIQARAKQDEQGQQLRQRQQLQKFGLADKR